MGDKQREAKVCNLREWSLTSLAQNRPTIQKQFCLSEVKQPLAKFATGRNLSQVVNDVKFWFLRVQCKHNLTYYLCVFGPTPTELNSITLVLGSKVAPGGAPPGPDWSGLRLELDR